MDVGCEDSVNRFLCSKWSLFAYVRKNYWDKALRTYRKVLDLNPGSKEREGIQKKIKEVQEKLEEERRNAER